jgi:hypothetical protein
MEWDEVMLLKGRKRERSSLCYSSMENGKTADKIGEKEGEL